MTIKLIILCLLMLTNISLGLGYRQLATIPDEIDLSYTGRLVEKNLPEQILQLMYPTFFTLAEDETIIVKKSIKTSQKNMRLDVAILKGNDLAMKTSFNIKLQQRSLPKVTDRLLISNNPEIIDYPGGLFSYSLLSNRLNRVLYFHRVTNNDNYNLIISLKNSNSYPVDFYYNSSVGGPDQDSIYTGNTATKQFWQKRKNQNSLYLTLPPFTTRQIILQKLQQKSIVSGILEILPVQGDLNIDIVAYNQSLGPESSFFNHSFNANFYRGGVYEDAWHIIDFTLGKDSLNKTIRIGEL